MIDKKRVPKLRFPEFKDAGEWEEKRLGEVAEYTKGFAFKSNEYCDSGIRIIQVSDLGATSIKENNKFVYISENKSEQYSKYKIKRNDIIITTVGSKPDLIESAVGRGILVRNSDAGFLNQNMLKINCNKSVSNIFIYGYISSKRYSEYINSIQRGNANQSNITVKDLFMYTIHLPSLPEQQKIADCLSSLDELINAHTKKHETLKTYKKGLMQKLFPAEGERVPELRFPEFKDAGEWEEKAIGELFEEKSRVITKPKGHYTGLGIRSHGKGTFLKEYQDPEKNSMDKLFIVKKDDLIVNITFAWEGAIAIVRESDDGALVSHRFPTYTAIKTEVIINLVRQIIIRSDFTYKLKQISPGGAGRNRVMSKNDFLKIVISIPSLPEQQKIADCLSSLDELINAESKKIEALKMHKKGLMQGLFPDGDGEKE